MEIRATIDVTEAVSGLHDLQKTHIPFALAKTLTGCAKFSQRAVQATLGVKFQLRNNFTRQGIRMKPAEKNSSRIEADVHTDTANRATGAPDYLLGQEEGGEKVPHGGRSHIAIPTRYLRQLAPGVIPAELRPRNLLGAVAGRYTARNRKGQIALRNQKIVRGFVFFIQNISDGKKAIMGRYWTDREAYPFYLLIPEAHIAPRLDMERTVEMAARQAFPELWADTWKQIMARGMKITSH